MSFGEIYKGKLHLIELGSEVKMTLFIGFNWIS